MTQLWRLPSANDPLNPSVQDTDSFQTRMIIICPCPCPCPCPYNGQLSCAACPLWMIPRIPSVQDTDSFWTWPWSLLSPTPTLCPVNDPLKPKISFWTRFWSLLAPTMNNPVVLLALVNDPKVLWTLLRSLLAPALTPTLPLPLPWLTQLCRVIA